MYGIYRLNQLDLVDFKLYTCVGFWRTLCGVRWVHIVGLDGLDGWNLWAEAVGLCRFQVIYIGGILGAL
jgi:hypothetical protein